MNHRGRDRHRRGNTLVETVLSVAMLSLVGGGMFGMVDDSEGMFQTSLEQSQARRETLHSYEVLRRELGQASLDSIEVDSRGRDGDMITFQVPLGLKSGEVVWGATRMVGSERIEYPGYSLRFQLIYETDGTRTLVRRILNESKDPIGQDQVLARGVDELEGGRKAFHTELDGRFLSVALRLRTSDEKDSQRVRTHSTLLRIRNA